MTLAPTTIALIEELLEKHQCAEIPGIIRKRQSIIVQYCDVLDIYSRIALSKLGRKRLVQAGHEARLCPPDFVRHASVEFNADLMKRYGVSVGLITRWRKETGIRPPEHRHLQKPRVAAPAPDGFALSAAMMTMRELRIRYGAAPTTIQRWLSAAGINCRRAAPGRKPNAYLVAPTNPVNRDMSRVGQAVEFLRHYSSIFRCAPTGRPDPKGSRWNRGGYVLDDAGVIERAEYLGWDADAWRRVA